MPHKGDGQRQVRVGEAFEVRLRSTPGSGSLWYLQPRSPALDLVETRLDPEPSIGGQAEQTFILRCSRVGSYELHFQLKRAWEQQVRQEMTVRVLAT